jgi:hypothetical protein
MHCSFKLAAGAAAILMAACSGGAPTASLPAAGGFGSPSHRTTHARLVIRVPPRRHRKKVRVHGHYISPATASLTYTISPALAGNVTSGEIDINTSNPDCQTTGVIGYLQCTIDIPGIVPGTPYTLGFITYDAAGGTGNQLSANDNVPFTANAGQNNVLQATLGGIASSLVVTPMTPYRMVGSGGSFKVYGQHTVKFSITPVDAQDNFIIGPGAPQPSASLAPGASATLSAVGASSPNEWTLTSSYAATDPLVASTTSIAVSATPVPDSGGSTVSATVGVSLYQPRIYISDTASTIYAFDEDGNPINPAPTFDSPGSHLGALVYGDGHLYSFSNNSGDAQITAYAPTGGSAIYAIAGAQNANLNNLLGVGGMAFDPHNDSVYVGGAGFSPPSGLILGFNASLTTETANSFNTDGMYGLAYVPQSQQLATVQQAGALGLCNEALTSCFQFGPSEVSNTGSMSYDENTQQLGFSPLSCCGTGGIQLVNAASGELGANLGPGLDIDNIVFDPYDGLWYAVWGNGSGVNAYTETGTQIPGVFSSWPGRRSGGITVVP